MVSCAFVSVWGVYMYFHMCVQVHVTVCVGMCVCVYACEDQRLKSGVFLDFSLLFFPVTRSLARPEA